MSSGPVEAPVPLTRPSFGPAEREAIERVMASGWVAGQGPEGATLESVVARLAGRTDAVAVSSCTAGLHLLLDALDVGPGDEVIVPDYTFPATAYAVMHCGARPVCVDVDPLDGCLDPALVGASVTDRTRAIIGVDALGLCADWDALREVSEAHDLPLVEDAACSLGGSYRDRPAGAFGVAAVFSLHARKGVTCGEGGVVVTDDQALARRVRRASSFGLSSAHARAGEAGFAAPEFTELGWNYKLSDLASALAGAQVGRVRELIALRTAAAERYAVLAAVEGVSVPFVPPERTHTWQTYAVTLADHLDRDHVVDSLRERGIGCTMGTYDLSSQPVLGGERRPSVARRLARQQLALPMFADITAEQQRRVVAAVQDVVASGARRVS
ncbi:DegT/DnrJ/EryC1/StrS family aminotransferase [Nocardioides sp. HDW12B]|uniref:DegT/DnrJ/EryC1/StrS family aminotransferase n=1 Tax=Nocardioides sp. HDW12B TaxID=2714939 RepID=UPI00140D38A9|nr:DegT/DnrJ/EryC1/StrS family aminotransferase [Nocardioides sp. HDW12B]QIK66062.1 DegT/DnrJ/EryC1/StrS family aminotransferase [Nocardioides sp. HDW12B]